MGVMLGYPHTFDHRVYVMNVKYNFNMYNIKGMGNSYSLQNLFQIKSLEINAWVSTHVNQLWYKHLVVFLTNILFTQSLTFVTRPPLGKIVIVLNKYPSAQGSHGLGADFSFFLSNQTFYSFIIFYSEPCALASTDVFYIEIFLNTYKLNTVRFRLSNVANNAIKLI